MLRRLRFASFLVFAVAVFFRFEGTVQANPQCECLFLGVDCISSGLPCSEVNDSFCSGFCYGASGTCGHAWTVGWVSSCDDYSSFSCACA